MQALLLAAPTGIARTQSVATSSNDRAVIVRADSLAWADLGLIPGVKIALLHGNPQDTGTYTLRLRFPAGTRMPAHWHPKVEYATLISGALWLGMGEREDSAKTNAGGAGRIPRRTSAHGALRGEHARKPSFSSAVQVHTRSSSSTPPMIRGSVRRRDRSRDTRQSGVDHAPIIPSATRVTRVSQRPAERVPDLGEV
jgi:quercetin dioxygenase-like cupin family protein